MYFQKKQSSSDEEDGESSIFPLIPRFFFLLLRFLSPFLIFSPLFLPIWKALINELLPALSLLVYQASSALFDYFRKGISIHSVFGKDFFSPRESTAENGNLIMKFRTLFQH